MPTLVILTLALLSLVAGLLVEPPAARAAKRKPAPPAIEAEVAPAGARTDEPATHKIVSEDIAANGTTRYVAVVVSKRISEADIGPIADAARAREKAPYERTVVNLYLPGMKLGGSAWAVATYQPSLKVTIVGLRLDEEQAALVEAANDKRNLLGMWLTSPPAVPGRLTIYREGAKTFAEWRLRNGSKSVEEVIETRDGRGRRLTPAAGSTDYFLLGPHGELELRDATSVIAVAERLPVAVDRQAAKAAPVKPKARSASRGSRGASRQAQTSTGLFNF